METEGIFGRLYVWMDWFTRLLYLNILWMGFSIVGLLVLGTGPATAGMFAVTRKWTMGETDVPIFRTFWTSYRREFWKANGLLWIFVLAGIVLYVDFEFFRAGHGALIEVMGIVAFIVTLIYCVILLYTFPVLVHYEARFFSYFRLAFTIGMLQPVKTLLLVVALYFMITMVRGVLPPFTVSTWSFLIMATAHRAMKKVSDATGVSADSEESQENITT